MVQTVRLLGCRDTSSRRKAGGKGSPLMSHPDSSSVVIEDLGDTTVVSLAGNAVRLDDALAAVFAEHLARLVEQAGRRQFLLNFANVAYLSSVGLGLLITLQKQLEGAGGCFVLCNVAPAVHEVFETTRLIHLLNICV